MDPSNFIQTTDVAPETPKKGKRKHGKELKPVFAGLEPRKRAKTDEEKAQRSYERTQRNRKAAELSRQRQKAQREMISQQRDELQQLCLNMLEENMLLRDIVKRLAPNELPQSTDIDMSQLCGRPEEDVKSAAQLKKENQDTQMSQDDIIDPSKAIEYSPPQPSLNSFDASVPKVPSLDYSPSQQSQNSFESSPTTPLTDSGAFNFHESRVPLFSDGQGASSARQAPQDDGLLDFNLSQHLTSGPFSLGPFTSELDWNDEPPSKAYRPGTDFFDNVEASAPISLHPITIQDAVSPNINNNNNNNNKPDDSSFLDEFMEPLEPLYPHDQ